MDVGGIILADEDNTVSCSEFRVPDDIEEDPCVIPCAANAERQISNG